jgi:serine/threonine-protein kinase
MALEWLPGGTLEDRLARGQRLADDETTAIAKGIAAALAHAHAQGLVHRDIKPANILFDDEGRPKLTDFGIAHLDASTTLTEAGTIMGTAGYIAPEQARGEQAGPPSDVFSFGAVLYRMLTGRLPFEAESPLELVNLHRQIDPPPVEALRPDAPPKLAEVTTAALAKDPQLRPRDGAALAAALGETEGETMLSSGVPTIAIPHTRPRRQLAAVPRIPLLLALVLLGVAGALAAVLVTRSGSGSQGRTTPVSTTTPGPTSSATTQSTSSAPTTSTAPATQPTTATSATTIATQPATTVQTTAPTTTSPTTAPGAAAGG